MPCVFIFNQYTIMITAKNGKRYITSSDVTELVYNCELTKKLEELQRRAETHYLNKEDNKPIKKGLFSKVKDTKENRTIMEELGILPPINAIFKKIQVFSDKWFLGSLLP